MIKSMWQKLEDWRAKRVTEGAGTTLVDTGDPRAGVLVTLRRWEGADGRLVMHVSDAHPCLLVLLSEVVALGSGHLYWTLNEYDLTGEPVVDNPLSGARVVRTVAPEAPEDGDRWALLRGWS
jgi:hypothetical protein